MERAIFLICLALLTRSASADLAARIVGGERAHIQDYPYQASLRDSGDHFCGGSIISSRHILTAAHCVQDDFPPYRYLSVTTGTSSSKQLGNSHSIARIFIHPEYTGTQVSCFANDIAVILLTADMKFSQVQKPIRLASDAVVSGIKATMTGWGYNSNTDNLPARKLQELQMTVLTYQDCQERLVTHRIRDKQFCGYQRTGHGACTGDSGGPLVYDDELIGVISLIMDGNCGIGTPEVYTNVYAHRDFITRIMYN